MKKLCGARTRWVSQTVRGVGRCRQYAMANGRCWRHGGRLKGGCLPGSRDMTKTNAARFRRLEFLHSMGLKEGGGHPFKARTIETMAEKAKLLLTFAASELVETLPSDVMTRQVEKLTAAEAWGRASLSGIYQLIRIIEQPLDMDNLKQQRLIGEMGLGVNRQFQRLAEGEKRDDTLDKLLATIEAEKHDKS